MLTILLSYYRIIERDHDGVWLSLARAPGLGPGGRRFESCYPESWMSPGSPVFMRFPGFCVSIKTLRYG